MRTCGFASAAAATPSTIEAIAIDPTIARRAIPAPSQLPSIVRTIPIIVRMRWTLLALVALVLGLSATAHAQTPTSPWSWTNYGPALRTVSCADATTCVAVGQEGFALHTTDGGPAGPLAWGTTAPRLAYPEELSGVSCTSTFCLAVSSRRTNVGQYASSVYRSTDGGATWPTKVALPKATVPGGSGSTQTQSAMAVGCNTDGTAVCYAVGPGGGVWKSVDQGASWTPLTVRQSGEYRKIDCPTAGTCVAISGSATVTSAAVITGDTVKVLASPRPFTGATAVGCDSATRCIVTDTAGRWVTLALPAGTWGAVDTFPIKDSKATPALDVSCAAPNTCIAVAGAGIVMRTTTLSTGSHGGWQRTPDGDAIPFNVTNVSCAASVCVMAGKAASWLASTNAGRTWQWINRIETLKAMDCPTVDTCVAGGNGISVTNTSGELWSAPLVDADLDTKWIGCTGPTTCLQLGRTGGVTTTDLRIFEGITPPSFSPAGISSGTCVSRQICVALAKTTLTTLNGGASVWGQTAFLPGIPGQIICLPGSSPVTCLATVGSFVAVGTMTLQGDAPNQKALWSWEFTDVDAEAALPGIACSPAPTIFCTAVGGNGQVWTTTDPTFMHWEEHSIATQEVVDDRPALTSVTCPAAGYCLAAGAHAGSAYIATTQNFWASYTEDAIDGIESASPTINAILCPTLERCIAIGETALVGVRNPIT